MIADVSTVETTLETQRSTRGRRATRISSDEREQAIMRTAELLLERCSLKEISVDDLARGAGISRPAFYFYFPSKDAVVLTLVDRLVEEATNAKEEALDQGIDDPVAAWRRSIKIFYEMLDAHRAVIRAVVELSATNAEARELRCQLTEGWVGRATSRIEAERRRGAAKRGLPARELATALVQMNERVMLAVFAEEKPAVSAGKLVDVLGEIWLSAIYGDSHPR
ncbi:MAG: TetR/AcrR family transcriptional regulator [Acidobacteriota bacterium]|nr:TetR/AcrR family transcriptional regulator [Acidobacteriota bacterium]